MSPVKCPQSEPGCNGLACNHPTAEDKTREEERFNAMQKGKRLRIKRSESLSQMMLRIAEDRRNVG